MKVQAFDSSLLHRWRTLSLLVLRLHAYVRLWMKIYGAVSAPSEVTAIPEIFNKFYFQFYLSLNDCSNELTVQGSFEKATQFCSMNLLFCKQGLLLHPNNRDKLSYVKIWKRREKEMQLWDAEEHRRRHLKKRSNEIRAAIVDAKLSCNQPQVRYGVVNILYCSSVGFSTTYGTRWTGSFHL